MPPVTATPAVGFLVGPGVLAHVDGVRALAERLGVAAVNTWGAKGVFRWDSPFHGGTAGLQARDFELAGLGEIDVLVTSGLDPAEVTGRPWEGRAEVVDVEPAGLAAFGDTWAHPPATPSRPRAAWGDRPDQSYVPSHERLAFLRRLPFAPPVEFSRTQERRSAAA